MTKEADLLFSVTDPDGRVYEVFTNGSIKGFPAGCVVRNWFHVRASEETMKFVASTAPRGIYGDDAQQEGSE